MAELGDESGRNFPPDANETNVEEPNAEQVLKQITDCFGEAVGKAFQDQDATELVVIRDLLNRDAESGIFQRLQMSFGQAVRFKAEFAYLLPPIDSTSCKKDEAPLKPTMGLLSSFDPAVRRLYLLKRKQVGMLASAHWKNTPKFNTPEKKLELAKFAEKIEKECAVPAVGFNKEGISKHIQDFFNEQRRYKKRKQDGNGSSSNSSEPVDEPDLPKFDCSDASSLSSTHSTLSVYSEDENDSLQPSQAVSSPVTPEGDIDVHNKLTPKLPSERSEGLVLAKLPEPSTVIPREKPIPKPKSPTKWEQYAKQKGISKKKRERMIVDKNTQEWKPRYGYKRANDETQDWLLEVPQNADPYEDQFEKKIQAKKERVAKNEYQRLRNIAKNKKIPVPNKNLEPKSGQQNKDQVSAKLNISRLSTASLGKFTEKLPKEKIPRKTGKKRKFEPVVGDMSNERTRSMELAEKIARKEPLDVNKAVSQHTVETQKRAGESKKKRAGKGKKAQGKLGAKARHKMAGKAGRKSGKKRTKI